MITRWILLNTFLFSLSDLKAQPSFRIPLKVSEHAGVKRMEEPVRSGIPFPQNMELSSIDSLRLTDDSGKIVPAHFEILGRWGGGLGLNLIPSLGRHIFWNTVPAWRPRSGNCWAPDRERGALRCLKCLQAVIRVVFSVCSIVNHLNTPSSHDHRLVLLEIRSHCHSLFPSVNPW